LFQRFGTDLDEVVIAQRSILGLVELHFQDKLPANHQRRNYKPFFRNKEQQSGKVFSPNLDFRAGNDATTF
jgi:hypothetical protein